MNGSNIAKWLRFLIYIHLVSIGNSLIGWLPVSGSLTTWVGTLILIGVTVVMFCLKSASIHYKKSVIFRAIWLGCRLINVLPLPSTVFVLAASLLSIFAVYEEYAGHAEIVAEEDPKLARNWGSLFGWNILVSVLASIASTIVAILMIAVEVDASAAQSVIMIILDIAQLVVDGFYLWYMIRTIRLLEPKD